MVVAGLAGLKSAGQAGDPRKSCLEAELPLPGGARAGAQSARLSVLRPSTDRMRPCKHTME